MITALTVLFARPSFAARACESAAAWPETAKKLDELARIAQCGPTFTQSECRANLGLGTATAALAASIGAAAAVRIRRVPKLCGLRGVAEGLREAPGFHADPGSHEGSSFITALLASFISSARAVSCVDPGQEMARHVRQQFAEAKSEIEENVRKTGRERLKADFPKLAANVDEQISIHYQVNSMHPTTAARDGEMGRARRVFLTAQLNKLEEEAGQMIGTLRLSNDRGRLVREQIYSGSDPDILNRKNAYDELFASRPNSYDPVGLEKKTYMNGITKRYAYDYSRSADTIKQLGLLETEIATKPVTPQRLAAMLDELAERAPSHQLARLATLRLSITERFKLPEPGAASRMAREGSKLIGKNGAKIGGGLLAVVTAGVAQASEKDGSVAYLARVGEEFVGTSHLGCGTRDSDWATIEGAGDCSYRPRWNAKTTDFALQPAEVQRRELAAHPQMCDVIEKVHAQLSASGLKVSCQPSGAVLRDERRRFVMDVAYDGDGLVKRASATGDGVHNAEYEIQFSGDQFEKLRVPSMTGAVFSTAPRLFSEPRFKTTDISRKMAAEKPAVFGEVLSKAEEHFAMMQPHIQTAQACCAGVIDGSDPRCEPVNRGRASGTGPSHSNGRGTTR